MKDTQDEVRHNLSQTSHEHLQTHSHWHNWTIGAPVKRSLIAYDH